MVPIKFDGQNVTFAEDQPEYLPLPAHGQPNGIITFCMFLSKSECLYIKKKKLVHVSVLCFGRPVQPIKVHFNKPEFPINPQSKWLINPTKFDEAGIVATFDLVVGPDEINELIKTRHLWISTVTYGVPLQPIAGQMKPSYIQKVKDDNKKARN